MRKPTEPEIEMLRKAYKEADDYFNDPDRLTICYPYNLKKMKHHNTATKFEIFIACLLYIIWYPRWVYIITAALFTVLYQFI